MVCTALDADISPLGSHVPSGGQLAKFYHPIQAGGAARRSNDRLVKSARY